MRLSLILFALLLCPTLFAQIFTPITQGDIVTDGGSSFGHTIADFNNDGWDDVFVQNLAATEPNFFYKNNGDGTFTKLTDIGIDEGNASTSATWADFNGDGHNDVYVANGGTVASNKKNFLFVNNGDETFTQILDGDIVNQQSAFTVCSWLDVENDGDLDLYVGKSLGTGQIFRNDGSGNFTAENLGDAGMTWGVSWSDFDKDGDLDGFGANWGAVNYFYLNDGNTLDPVTMSPLTNGTSASVSPSWGDYNNDGWMDLFVGNSFAEDRLFTNNGDGSFTEYLDPPVAGITMNSEGSAWGDIDNDGDLDLIVGSGGNQSTGEMRVYINNGDESFTEIEDGQLTTIVGRYEGVTCSDYDGDGDLDLFLSNYLGNNNMLYNNAGNDNNWLAVQLTGVTSNTNAIGAKVYAYATINGDEVCQYREVICHAGHVTQSSFKQHFGLGDATVVDSVVVVWPTQLSQTLVNVEANQCLEISEDIVTHIPAEIASDFQFEISPNPIGRQTRISFTLSSNQAYSIDLTDLDGSLISRLHKGYGVLGRNNIFWDRASEMQNLPSGVYFLTLRTGQMYITEKVVLMD